MAVKAPHSLGDTRLPECPNCQCSACSTGSCIFQGIKPSYPPWKARWQLSCCSRGVGSCCTPSVSLPSRWRVKDEVAPVAPGAASTSTEGQLQQHICMDTHRDSCALPPMERMLLTVLKQENSNLSACCEPFKQTSACKTEM